QTLPAGAGDDLDRLVPVRSSGVHEGEASTRATGVERRGAKGRATRSARHATDEPARLNSERRHVDSHIPCWPVKWRRSSRQWRAVADASATTVPATTSSAKWLPVAITQNQTQAGQRSQMALRGRRRTR